tara:strand:- start:396 stop:548 length:153 start_codon:yes stop_codon:yes gene_type:complete
MRLNNGDIHDCIRACLMYQDQTGSEEIWERYDDLIHKLRIYADQHSPSEP